MTNYWSDYQCITTWIVLIIWELILDGVMIKWLGKKKEYAGIINKCYFGSKTIVTSTALPVDVDLLNGNIHFSHYIQSEVFFTILRGLGVVVYWVSLEGSCWPLTCSGARETI